mgnify:CR=1 FL=1
MLIVKYINVNIAIQLLQIKKDTILLVVLQIHQLKFNVQNVETYLNLLDIFQL